MAYYDIDLYYYHSKFNMVLNALSKKTMTMFLIQLKELLKEIRQLELDITLPSTKT